MGQCVKWCACLSPRLCWHPTLVFCLVAETNVRQRLAQGRMQHWEFDPGPDDLKSSALTTTRHRLTTTDMSPMFLHCCRLHKPSCNQRRWAGICCRFTGTRRSRRLSFVSGSTMSQWRNVSVGEQQDWLRVSLCRRIFGAQLRTHWN